jgi:hypothetical protein
MKKNVLVFGSISGLIITAMMVGSSIWLYNDQDFKGNMILGYAAMLLSFSFIFVGIKNFRDKYNDGFITFGKAFKTGFLIALISSTCYVLVWQVEYYFFIPDFMEKYSAHVIKEIKESGATEAVLDAKITEMKKMSEAYKNPIIQILITYSEVLPLGVLISLISALILKKKPKEVKIQSR